VSLICFTSCAVAARGTNRTSARTAKNNRPRNLRRVDIAYPFRMNDMAGSPSRSTLATPQFWLRHDGRSLTYAKSTLFTPILCEYRRSGRTLSAVANARRRVARRRIQTNGQKGPPGVVWIKNHRNVCNVGRDLFQSLQHLADDLDLH